MRNEKGFISLNHLSAQELLIGQGCLNVSYNQFVGFNMGAAAPRTGRDQGSLRQEQKMEWREQSITHYILCANKAS